RAMEVGTVLEVPSLVNPVLPPYLPYRPMSRWPQFRHAAMPGTDMVQGSNPHEALGKVAKKGDGA
ncbi:MAG: hypothetical protein K6T26_04240, partial [Alicyclobacillus sp.]|nr:hypothetical protein [Alicyclobacillus sp.]